MFNEFLKKIKWDSITVAVAAIVMGILCLVMPTGIGNVLCIAFGCLLIATSVVLFVKLVTFNGFFGANLLISAVVTFLSGVFCLVYPGILQSVLTVLFGLFIVIDSLASLSDAILCAKAKTEGWVVLFILSFITACLGVVVMFSTFETVMVFAGVSLIIEGVRRLIITLAYSRKIRDAKKIVLGDDITDMK